MVEAPHAVLPGQVGMRRVGGQQVVEPGRGGLDVALRHPGEDAAQVGGQGHEPRRVGGDELGHRRRVDGQHPPDRGLRVAGRRHGQLVDQVYGGEHAGIGITV